MKDQCRSHISLQRLVKSCLLVLDCQVSVSADLGKAVIVLKSSVAYVVTV